MRNQHTDALPHVQAQVGGDLLIAAAPRMQLEAKIPDGFDKVQLDEVMDILRVGIHGLRLTRSLSRLVGLLRKAFYDAIESIDNLPKFALAQNGCSVQRASVRLAGCSLFLEQRTIELERALPVIE